MMTQSVMFGDLISEEYFSGQKITFNNVTKNQQPLSIQRNDIIDQEYAIPVAVQGNLRRISQLGLKELWLGGTPGKHDRWKHSVGALNAGFIWLKVLESDDRVPKHCMVWPTNNWEKVRALVGTAILLHDYGHLPFAHLFNEVLASMNWLPSSRGGADTAALLHKTRAKGELDLIWNPLLSKRLAPGLKREISTNDVRLVVESLILGSYGVPWVQTIANSPIDADKIDYIRFDSDFLRDTDYPIRPRLQEDKPTQWMMEFLQDQWVNHAGLLCLHGRSALATADLWRERIFLSDRLYLSPELRVPESMAFEIIQQFIIRSTMSSAFMNTLKNDNLQGFAERFEAKMKNSKESPDYTDFDTIAVKYETAYQTMEEMLPLITGEELEFSLLVRMNEKIQQLTGIDQSYKNFLKECFLTLEKLKNKEKSLAQVVSESLVQRPLLLYRQDFDKIREALRPLQHTYCREALIDIVRLPRVLAAPRRWRSGFGEQNENGIDYSILVPSGPVSTWGPGSRATCPLTDECVQELERPYCRVTVISPGRASSAQAAYIWDRVRSTLLEANLQLVEEVKEIEW